MEFRRVVVTGAAGFIGSHLADRLLSMGAEVVAIDNFDTYYEGKEQNVQHNLGNPRYKLIKLDILELDSLIDAFKGADVVFHLAAQPGVRFSMNNPHKTNRINVSGTLNVLLAVLKCGVKRLVYASSSSVYGVPVYLPMDENHPTNPISVYGASKLAAEKYCRVFYEAYKLPVVILRYHTVYGPRQRPDMAIHKWTKRLLEGKPPIIYGDGKQTRDFTYIDDIVDGTIKAAETENIEGETFNLGSGKRTEINKIVKMLLKITGKDINPVYEPAKKGDVPHTHADITKAKKILGYSPKFTLDDGLEKFVSWYESKTPCA